MLKLAKGHVKRTGVQDRVKQFVDGSVDDLSMFDDETFDAVLCLGGALGHKLNAKRREKASMELIVLQKVAHQSLFPSLAASDYSNLYS